MALPGNGPFASAAFIRQFALRCEALGYDSLWIPDHMTWSAHDAAARFPAWAAGRPLDALEPHQYEPIATLAYLAGCTTGIGLGTAVLVLPVRNPVVLAKQVAALDDLCGGRLSLGVGVGGTDHADADFGAVGADHLRSRRGKATDEWIDVMRRVWSQPSCSYSGALIDVRDAWIFPKPAQAGGPPILIGGDSEPALQRVARLADGSIVSRLAPDDVARRRDRLAALAEPHRRSGVHFHLMVSQWLSIAGDEAVAVARAGRQLSGVKRGGRSLVAASDNLIGAPGRLQGIIGAYAASGVDEIMLQVVGESESEVLESLHHFADDVLASSGRAKSGDESEGRR